MIAMTAPLTFSTSINSGAMIAGYHAMSHTITRTVTMHRCTNTTGRAIHEAGVRKRMCAL